MALERIEAQIESGSARQRWVFPPRQAMRGCSDKTILVVVNAHRADRAFVEIKEFVTAGWHLPARRVGEVVAVEMNLEGLVTDFHSFE